MLGSVEDIKLWEEARCPVCLEHPHNAVLLRCSSFTKGCRPFMCNTSPRHSNCLDQFCKSSVPSPSRLILPGVRCEQTDIPNGESVDMLTCPLCRGQVYGWFVIEPAREFMNSKTRSCSNETCEFTGNYMELRKHARSDHPDIRPSAVDPERQRNWTRLESEITLSNLLSIFPSMNLGLEGYEEEDGVVILDDIDIEFDNHYIRLAAEAAAVIDDVWCFDSITSNNFGPNNYGQMNYFGPESYIGLPPSLNNYGGHYYNYNFRGWNSNVVGSDVISRQNRGWNSNGAGNNFVYRQNSRNNRNQDNLRHNSVNNNLNPRQNNSFRGNNTQRMRDARVNGTAPYNNWRNGSDRRGNRNGSRNGLR